MVLEIFKSHKPTYFLQNKKLKENFFVLLFIAVV
jgi:hypothetical protein